MSRKSRFSIRLEEFSRTKHGLDTTGIGLESQLGPDLNAKFVTKLYSLMEEGNAEQLIEELSNSTIEACPTFLNKEISPYGMSLLHMSVGLSDNDPKFVKILLDYGGDPNNINCTDKVSPLHLSLLYEFDIILDLLLSRGGDPYFCTGDGENCFDLAETQEETDLLKTILLKYTSFSGMSSISDDSTSRISVNSTSGSTNTFFTCESVNEKDAPNLMTDDDDDSLAEFRGKRYGKLSTIKEETSSIMKKYSPPHSHVVSKLSFVQEVRDSSLSSSPDESKNYQYDSEDSMRSISQLSACSTSTTPRPPSPTNSEMHRLELTMSSVKIPVTKQTYHTLAKFVSPVTNKLVLTQSEDKYSAELKYAIQKISSIHDYGGLKVDLLQCGITSPSKREAKSYYNYVLLDPKIIKRVNFSGNHLKSDVIKSTEKFRKFISAIFYIGKGCGNRPLSHLVDAKMALNRKDKSVSEKIQKILDIWKSGQGVIVQSFYHHSTEREANVNEAAMIDAMGLSDLSNVKKGSYAGTASLKWSQKEKNQFGVFLLHKCFQLYAVNNGKEFFPQDV